MGENSINSILKSMDKFNKELDDKSSKINYSKLKSTLTKNNDFEQTYSDPNEEVMQSILEVRFEMNLIRKNLANDIELVIKKVINESKKTTQEVIKKTYEQVDLQMKKTFISFVSDIQLELNKLKIESESLREIVESNTEVLSTFVKKMDVIEISSYNVKKNLENQNILMEENNRLVKNKIGLFLKNIDKKSLDLNQQKINAQKVEDINLRSTPNYTNLGGTSSTIKKKLDEIRKKLDISYKN